MVAVIPRIVPIAPGPRAHDLAATWRCVAALLACQQREIYGQNLKGLMIRRQKS